MSTRDASHRVRGRTHRHFDLELLERRALLSSATIEPVTDDGRHAVAAGPGHGERPWPQIVLSPLVEGLSNPVFITHAGDATNRLFIVEQPGQIRIVESGVLNPTPFLDIADRVSCCGEQGLLSVAFPPNYAGKGYFYVDYTDVNGDTVVSRFHRSTDANRANADSEEVLLRVDQPFGNHNGGLVMFGPDGFLYVGLGDGGGAGDPLANGQNASALLGKLLRIEVESGAATYAIPASNPFADRQDVRPEIWALGLRNPWRFSFDRLTGDLYIGDVGQGAREEIDFQPAASPGGENYGWRTMEGTLCFRATTCDQTGLVLPVTEYSHAAGCSVTGGHVSRAADSPDLFGLYFYGDFCSGQISALRRHDGSFENALLLNSNLGISSFGEDEAGHVFVIDYFAGTVFRIDGVDDVASADLRLTAQTTPGSAAAGTDVPFTFAVTNDGPDTADSVLLRVAAPTGSVLTSASADAGTCRVGGSLVCEFGAIENGGIATATLVFRAATAGSFAVTATVAAEHAIDLDDTDNTAGAAKSTLPSFEFRFPTATVSEAVGTVELTVARRGGNAGPATVAFHTSDASASAQTDYSAQAGLINFEAGQSTGLVAIDIVDNTMSDGDRSFRVVLDAATGDGAVGEWAEVVVHILDDETLERGSIVGRLFEDLDGDGVRESNEPPLSRWTVFLDGNANRQLDPGERLAQSRTGGRYRLDGLSAGTYAVAAVPKSWHVLARVVSVVVGAGESARGIDVSAYRPATIHGRVFHDHDRDGVRAPEESPLDGIAVFLDLDGSGARTVDEPLAVTNARGKYRFVGLAPGTYRVVQVVPNGIEQVAPATGPAIVTLQSGERTQADFADEISEAPVAAATRTASAARDGARTPWDALPVAPLDQLLADGFRTPARRFRSQAPDDAIEIE